MNKKNITILLVVLVVLGVLFFSLDSGSKDSGEEGRKSLFSDIDPVKIARIRLEQGPSSLELKLNNDAWTIPSRGGYRADGGKVKSLFLYKILDLSVSQSIPVGEKGLEKLGLNDEAVKQGKGKVSFLDKEGKVLAGLYIGEHRKQEVQAGMPAIPTGQYVKRLDQNVVYLTPQTISVLPDVSNWLDAGIANVLQGDIERIDQYAVLAGAESLEFSLVKSGATGEDFKLDGDLPADKEIDATAVSNAKSGLSNLRMTDVMKADGVEAAGFSFDRKTVYHLENALEYSVLSAEKDKKYYAKIRVSFNEGFAAEISKRAEEAKKTKPVEGEASESSAKPDEPKLSSLEEAKKLNDEHSKWIYELAQYQGKKFRVQRLELIKDKKQEEKKESAKKDEKKKP